MSNFTAKLVFTNLETDKEVQRFYTCRCFEYVDGGELVLRGLSGTTEDAVMWITGGGNYHSAYVTNEAGKTVFAHRMPQRV